MRTRQSELVESELVKPNSSNHRTCRTTTHQTTTGQMNELVKLQTHRMNLT